MWQLAPVLFLGVFSPVYVQIWSRCRETCPNPCLLYILQVHCRPLGGAIGLTETGQTRAGGL